MKKSSLAALMGISITSNCASAATFISGHVDFIGIGYEGGVFEPHSHAHAGAVVLIDGVPTELTEDTEYELGELIVQTSTTSLRAADAAWNSTGVESGQSYYILSETEIEGQPFIGVGAEELTPGDWNSDITITLTGATGSGITAGGIFSLAQTSGGVPTFFMSTLNGISEADVFSMDLNADAHAHFIWGFTEVGTYNLTFEIAGTHSLDNVEPATATYTFNVVPEPSSALLGGIGALALLRRRRN
jgi:surface-anchored protein